MFASSCKPGIITYNESSIDEICLHYCLLHDIFETSTKYLFGNHIDSIAAIYTVIGYISGFVRACYISGSRS